jgi:hypothetical protein
MASYIQVFACVLAVGWLLQPPDTTELAERLRFLQAKAAELELAREGDGESRFPLMKVPVLRYTNVERTSASTDGATFLWVDGTRPVAAVSLSIRDPNDVVVRECTSFVDEKLTCQLAGATVWTPPSGNLVAQSFPEAPSPAKSKTQRLVQIRNLARRFEATCYNRKDEPFALRLLPQPLHRYESDKARILDGAIFGFVVSNDPELLLVIEAVQPSGDEPAWRYTLARMSSWKETVKLDGKEVWSVDNYYDLGNRTGGPYSEARAGTFVPGEAPAK